MKAALLAVAALAATLVAASPAAAANQLSFGDAPAGWSVTSGEADADLGTVRATGVKKNRIRYSLQGSAGFSVRPRSGVVSYDGTELPAGEALLTITARDRKGKVADASVTITVTVTPAQPAPQLERYQPPALPQNMPPPDPTLYLYQADWRRSFDHDRGRYRTVLRPAPSLIPMVGEGRSESALIYVDSWLPDSLRPAGIVGSQVTWELDQSAKDLGFFLEQLVITGASQGSPITSHREYKEDTLEETVALSYNGTSWPDDADLYNFKIKVTGTREDGTSYNTVEIEVCFLRSQ